MVHSGGFFGLLNPIASVGSTMSSYPKTTKNMDPKEWKINSTGYNLQDLKFLVQNIKKGI